MKLRKNILLIYTDQQRWDTINALGNSNISTPNLNRLVESGVSFSRAFVNCPVCMPSRMSMLSGRYPATLGIQSNGSEMPESVECVQHLLQRVGYRTANLGKLHFRNHASAYRDHADPYPAYGFDININSDEPGCYDDSYIEWVRQRDPTMVQKCRIDTPPAWTGTAITGRPRDVYEPYVFEGEESYSHSAFVAERTCQFLRESNGRQPFFCIAGFYAPHTPINPPQRFVDMYDASTLPLPNRRDGQNFRSVTDGQWQQIRAYYYALISHVDDQIGRILDTLEAEGLSENTAVVFTSDHGEYLGDHGRIQKGGAEDASSRVPLLFQIPGIDCREQSIDSIVEATDIVPTLLALCEVPKPSWCRGESLLPLIKGERFERDRGSVAFIELKNGKTDGYKAIRCNDFLYIYYLDGRESLFNLREDPNQLSDIAAAPGAAKLLAEARSVFISKMISCEGEGRRKTGPY